MSGFHAFGSRTTFGATVQPDNAQTDKSACVFGTTSFGSAPSAPPPRHVVGAEQASPPAAAFGTPPAATFGAFPTPTFGAFPAPTFGAPPAATFGAQKPSPPGDHRSSAFAQAKNKNQPAPFSFATTHKKALVIHGVTATPDPKELAERKAQADLFTGAVLRDAYLFLLNPASPGVAAPPGPHEAPQHLGAALLGKPSAVSGSLDTFAFVDRAGLPTSLPDGWRLLDEATTLSALDHLGEPSPLPLAATRAFEQYLEEKARAWADAQVARLSVEFLVAFARELTPRLDVHHRMRSRALSQDELLSLSTLPFANGVDPNVLRRYQQPLLPCTPPPPALTMNAQTALGANAAQTVAAPLQPPQQLPPTRPETPGLLPHPLPPSPRAVEPATSTPGSLVSRLFTKVAQ